MASLVAVAKSYRMKRAQVTKLRRKDQHKLKEILSQKRRLSSGLASLERKREATSRYRDHIMQLLNQALAQRDSLGRLKTAAEERPMRAPRRSTSPRARSAPKSLCADEEYRHETHARSRRGRGHPECGRFLLGPVRCAAGHGEARLC